MGIWSKIVNFFKSKPEDDGSEERSMYNVDDGPTLIYSDEPNLSDAVYDADSGRMVGHASTSARADLERVARANASMIVPGQIVNRQRPRRPMQRPVQQQQPVQQPQQQAQPAPEAAPAAPEAAPAEQPVQQVQQPAPQPQPQPVYQQPVYQQPMYQQPVYQQPYYQQPYGYQQQPQYYQQPVQQPQGDDEIKLVQGERIAIAPNFPAYEMIEVNGVYHLYIDLPGVKKSELKMNFSGGSLYVSGHRELMCEKYRPKGKGKGNKGKKPQYEALIGVGRHLLGDFSFPFYFPKPVDTSPDSFKANLADGILHIEMKVAGADTGISIGLG